jgi:SHOCT-like protein
MSDERRRVLDLLAQGKITVEEADQLLRALGAKEPQERAAAAGDGAKQPPRFIRIAVRKPATADAEAKDINIRVPLPILKGGMRLGALIPGFVGEKIASRLRERGCDFDWSNLDGPAIHAIFAELTDMGIDVDSEKAQVRITCE